MGGSSSHSTSKPTDVTPQAFKDLQGPFAGVLSNLLGQYNTSMGSNLLSGYQGPTTTPMSSAESIGLGNVNNIANAPAPTNAAQTTLLNNTMQGTGIAGSNPNDPLLQDYIKAAQRPTQQALDESLTRDLPGRFVMSGQSTQPGGSSAFDRAAAIATRGAGDTMGTIATNIAYQNQQAGAQRALDASGQTTAANTAASSIKSQDVNTAIANLNAQALPRLIQDLGVERGMETYNNNINSILAGLGIVAGTTRPVISSTSNSSSGGFNLK